MRRHTTHSLILTAALALSLVPALQAQGYDNRRSIFPDTGHLDRVSVVAHQIDETALSISRQYARNNRRPDRDEARALERLRDLSSAAGHFHDQVESYRREPRHTADDFARLEQAFYAADRSLSRIAPRPYVDSGMNRIHDLMNELGGYYGRHAGYYGAWGHDHDQDRDHDHDNGYRPPHHR
ncbi:MAG TPA: hypothetical protein VGM86_22380 [Thermoanaerobaculia bacterium]|jgi:hypothetical protein